ncbi:MAG: aldehyde dehydrogenase family protein, partial [Deltaproteobacteria bacterium]
RELAPRLVTDPRPAVISFTGSDVVGWKIKATAGPKRVLLELGGAAPVLVQPDADLDHAAERIAYGAFAYAGQVCISVQRVLAHRDVADALRERLRDRVQRAVPWGDPRNEATVSGPLISVQAADRVQSWIEAATRQGARILAGGGREGPQMLRPAVLDSVPRSSELVQRELFGPAVVVDVYDELDQGIALANAGPWGLQAGVFTRDIGAIFQCHRQLEVGGVIHDDVPTWRVDHMPYGGVKRSGLGREGLRYAIAEFTEPRLLALRV